MNIEQAEKTDSVLAEVMYERMRQVGKGYDAAHDDTDEEGNHARAAAFYATAAYYQRSKKYQKSCVASGDAANRFAGQFSVGYPWESKTMSVERIARDNLVKASALLVAEIERIDSEESGNDQ